MTSSICTLFEGHYHFGVAALTNSLYAQGYRGALFAGYRGALPAWASAAEQNRDLQWEGSSSIIIEEDFKIHFLPLHTDYHLTNYKPDFMLRLWEGPARDAGKMVYFDPDIVVSSPWSFFEEWIGYCGLALCEDVNSPLGEHHPQRMAWRKYFGEKGIILRFKEATYANGGFVGVNKEHISFLLAWKEIQELMAPAIGGLDRSLMAAYSVSREAIRPYAPFLKTDQDALNATLEAWTGRASFIGQEAMAFKPGEVLMPHALGQPKPWQLNPLIQILDGYPPRRAEQDYWKFANGPIFTQPSSLVYRRQMAMKLASLIGRFYRRK